MPRFANSSSPPVPLAPRWVTCAACLAGMSLLPSLVLGVSFGHAHAGSLLVSPIFAILFLACLEALLTGRCRSNVTDCIVRAASALRSARPPDETSDPP